MAQLCRRFGVSRKIGYKWLGRWQDGGKQGLHDRSRRPHGSSNKSSDSIEEQVVKLRRQYPEWGGRKLNEILVNRGLVDVPSPSSITRSLHRHVQLAA